MTNRNDAALRALIAAACVATIVGVGYSVIGEYRTSHQEQEVAQRPLVDKVLRDGCLEDLAAIVAIDQKHPYTIANCLYLNALREAEVKAREEVLGVRLR